MRESGLAPEVTRRYVVTTDAPHDGPLAADLLDRDVCVVVPNHEWARKITAIPSREGLALRGGFPRPVQSTGDWLVDE